MSDNEVEDVSFLPGPGQGGTGKRAVYEPNGSQRCKQIVCTRAWAISTVVIFFLLILAIALIAAFSRSGSAQCLNSSPSETTKSAVFAETTVQPEAQFPWKDIRLPKSVIPLDYEIFLHPNLTTFLFKGRVDITVQVQTPVNFLVLHEKNLNITMYDLMETETHIKVAIEQDLHNKASEQVFIMLSEELTPGRKYTLNLHFDGELTDLMAGFYRSSYTTTEGETRWLATTQFEATDARAAFPCFDEPELKASFTLSMVREKRHISLFNMPRTNTEAYTGGLEVDHFETSVKMSTYLVAFIVCDFKSLDSQTGKGTKVSVYAPPHQIDQAQFALGAAVKILEYYEHFFGIPYPLPKQDLVAIPDFAAGAMENWGLITYRTTTLLYDPQESSSRHQERVAIVEAHELAHQWFGNLVTMKWWNDLWLNEGFATFMEYIGADRVNPDWQESDQFVTKSLLWALHEDSLSNSHPIRSVVKDPTEISEIFDTISYNKGAAIIRMLESVIGREALERGLKDYLDKYKYSNAETDDLWEALSKVANLNVKSVMDTWTLQMGYPMLDVRRTSTDGVIAQQKRFLLHQSESESTEHVSPFGYQWKIPLTYVTDKSTRISSTTHWMTNDSVRFEISDDAKWVKANVNFTGYYRVHYNPENWEALSQQLERDPMVFSAADRAELIDDAFAMVSAGYHKAPVALQLADYLVKEVDYSPWYTALSNYGYMGNLLEDKEAYQYYKIYMQKQLESVMGFLGWEDKGSYLNKLLRNIVLKEAVRVNLKPAVQYAKELFNSWMVNGTRVPKELKYVVFTVGIQYGGDKEWKFTWDQYQTTQISSEKAILLKALSTTPDAAALNRYLHMTLDEDKIRKQDTTNTVNYIANTAAGRVLAWRFLKQHWAEFERRYGGASFDMDGLIKGVIGGFSTQYDHDEVKAFFEAHKEKVGRRAIAQALESIMINIGWLDRNLKDVTVWLRNKVAK